MDKQTLRYTYLTYFAGQCAKNENLDVDTLIEIAGGNCDLCYEVLYDMVTDGIVTGIEAIKMDKGIVVAHYDGQLKLTSRGLKEIVDLFPKEKKISNNIEQNENDILKTNNTLERLLKSENPAIKKAQKYDEFWEKLEQNNKKLQQNNLALEKSIEMQNKILQNFNNFNLSQNKSFKLLNIYLHNFKNLKNIKIDCSNLDNLLLLIGNNACGKSNILEAISAIFTEVYTRKRIPHFEYELSYSIDSKIITIKRETKNPYFIINGDNTTRQRIIQDNLLPSKIIALYSGEETRLWEEYYEKFYFQYLRDLTSGTYETFGKKMLYINKYYWNIALLILMVSNNNDHKIFIEDKLKIDTDTVNIKIDFNIEFLKKNKSEELAGFINEINPSLEDRKNYSLGEFKTIIMPEYDSNLQKYIEKYSLEQVFEILVYASMPKFKKAFKNIEIIFNNGLSIKSLSEGEKKYILIYTVVDILADEKSIILMDEPDAHIHEFGKSDICSLFEQYSNEYNRQILVTTHSPTLAHCTDDKHIIMLENNNGTSSIIDHEKVDMINKLTGGMWSEIQQNIFLNSTTPLILFEGVGDINYVKKAIEIFKDEFPKLNKLDFLPFGGAANACEFIQKIRNITNKEKQIIMVFDRDEAGQNGLGKCLPPNAFKDGVKNTKTYLNTANNVICLMLPMTEERKSLLPQKANGSDLHFLIEDCFSSLLRKQIAQDCIEEANGFFNKYTKDLKDHIKQMLTKEEYHTPDNMLGFKPLLIKIQNIIEGNEPLEKV